MPKQDISMTPEEVAVVLAETRHLQVATLGADGYPHLTTLWFVVMDGMVTFRSFTKSQRVTNLERNPKLSVLAETGSSYADLRGVMIKGRARLIADPTLVRDVYHRVTSKMEGVEVDGGAIETMFGRFFDKNTVVQIEPVSIISWDHRKLGGDY